MLWLDDRKLANVAKSWTLSTSLYRKKPSTVWPSRLNHAYRREYATLFSSSKAATGPWRVRQISSDSKGTPRKVYVSVRQSMGSNEPRHSYSRGLSGLSF